jgi:DNA polymerase-4
METVESLFLKKQDFSPRILHLDMDSYFASVAQQANPKLAHQPVGIIKALGRACVIAASREAKQFGVKTGMTTWEAKQLCPRIIFVAADFDQYFSVTKKFIQICSRFSPELELFSIDELFLDVNQTQQFFGGVDNLVALIKIALKEEVGPLVTVSVGLSYNRLLAKLASGVNKPDGFFEITPENRDEVLFKIKLNKICGLGFRLEERLLNMGIRNFQQLRQIPLKFLEASFGPYWSIQLKKLSYGIDDLGLISFYSLADPKTISRTFTLFRETNSLTEIKQTLFNLCQEVCVKARDLKMRGRYVGLAVRGEDQAVFAHQTLKYFLADEYQLFQIAYQLFKQSGWSASVRFLGVSLSLLAKESDLTISFLENLRKEDLLKAVDEINHRYGDFTLYPACLLGGELIRPEVNGFLGDKQYQFREFSPDGA